MKALLWLLFIAGGFASGSVMYCQIIPRLLTRKDISQISDDHNPGAFNVFSHCGKGVGVLCLSCDILKGFIPVLLASLFMNSGNILFSLVVIAPVLGHAVGMFNRFHGGKCIATSFGVTAGLIPVSVIPFVILAALYILFSAVIKIKPNRKCSIIVYACFAVITCTVMNVLGFYTTAFGCVIIAAIAIFRHTKYGVRREAGENNVDCR